MCFFSSIENNSISLYICSSSSLSLSFFSLSIPLSFLITRAQRHSLQITQGFNNFHVQNFLLSFFPITC
ncbi:hypothetical protein PIB30_000814 [Stylosanthes scabra]|uniref:Uncharacterized protein n=1 Tax=Stylosanthes scabra TaxID=79078 RepID=A0ABU6Q2A8_9FABA|nr:hypothetical protein [Stylosanthes scabra]